MIDVSLQAVTIAKQASYSSDNPGKWVAQVKYGSSREESSILLSEEAAVELLALVGPLIAKRAAEAAQAAAGLIAMAVEEAKAKQLGMGSIEVPTSTV